jgi:hypothetical protein
MSGTAQPSREGRAARRQYPRDSGPRSDRRARALGGAHREALSLTAHRARRYTWAEGPPVGESVLTNQAFAAMRPPGEASFGAPEAIADPDVASPSTVAFDRSTGRPTVAWAARLDGVDTSTGVDRTAILRFATRQAP